MARCTSLHLARGNLAALLSERGRFEEAWPHWDALIAARSDDRGLLDELLGVAMRAGELTRASAYAEHYAALSRGSRWHPKGSLLPVPATPSPAPQLSIHKLRHNIEQFRYLQRQGILGGDFTAVIHAHERVLAGLLPRGESARAPFGDAERALIGDVYDRIVHLRPTPRVPCALSGRWDGATVEDMYLAHPLGIVVVDDFLCEEALHSLRLFCLQSTVWFTHRYAHGRIGALFRDGFNCPLLLQIGDEVRLALPRLIGDKHRLLQIWGFKYNYVQPKTSAHADFAAVNVNFWITPDDANLERESGGMVIYDVEAPRDWSFDNYNKQGEKIEGFLAEKRARQTVIPYRANRAVIFNSDLFHTTSPLRFREGYENRRINVTMLYGKREEATRPG
jgi:hypothetical protein